jgi:hypothetical protein
MTWCCIRKWSIDSTARLVGLPGLPNTLWPRQVRTLVHCPLSIADSEAHQRTWCCVQKRCINSSEGRYTNPNLSGRGLICTLAVTRIITITVTHPPSVHVLEYKLKSDAPPAGQADERPERGVDGGAARARADAAALGPLQRHATTLPRRLRKRCVGTMASKRSHTSFLIASRCSAGPFESRLSTFGSRSHLIPVNRYCSLGRDRESPSADHNNDDRAMACAGASVAIKLASSLLPPETRQYVEVGQRQSRP